MDITTVCLIKKDNFELAVIEREQTCNFVSSLFMRKNVSNHISPLFKNYFHVFAARVTWSARIRKLAASNGLNAFDTDPIEISMIVTITI